ncbi:MAG TPA: sulfite exporter TauE/SafE family protein [Thermoanaerobaculia bacterium]|nr:sulfite exporter TauE/SafE family protein [Thermoanaerobaculia bacterium]
MTLVWSLIGALVAGGAFFLIRWVLEARRITSERGAAMQKKGPTPLDLAIGFVTNFFDTLGIGSFATTTAAFRLFCLVPDELIPGTIIVGDALAVLTQAVLFISVVEVDPLQLTALIAVCVAGGWIGTGIVTRLSRRAIQLGIGTALIVAALFMAFGMFGLIPAGGTARALTPTAFVLALAINFALGALLPLGIGNYAPSLVMFSLLGMDPRAAFPIMMGSGAFVATVAGARFLSARRFHQRMSLGLTLGGIPGVMVAVWLVKSLPLEALRVLVLVVVLYVSVTLLRRGQS